MARTARTPISALQSNINAAIVLLSIKAVPASYEAGTSFVPGKPTRLRGKRRDGQHRSHTCSRTSSGGTKKKGN